ncbi:MAG: lipoprotein [Duodenibacillus sp.]|nr:lipoprotein [Duodenibacillus sp.]
MLRVLIAIVCLAGLTACGQYGDLYMPDPYGTTAPTTAPQPPEYSKAQ